MNRHYVLSMVSLSFFILLAPGSRAQRVSTSGTHAITGGQVVAGANGSETVQPVCRVLKKNESLRNLLPPCWYQRVAGWEVVTLKKHMEYGFQLSLKPSILSHQLDEIKAHGIQAIEILAPAWGHSAYGGLDTVDQFRMDPGLGTIQDFRQAVRLAHGKGLAVVVFINLGYLANDAPSRIKAQRDKGEGKDTPKVRWFLWSDNADAPEPHTQEDIYATPADREEAKAYWGWHWSKPAHAYYWSRWRAIGPNGEVIPLPQANWGDPGWQEQAANIVRFWMNTGIDGMLVDGAICYPNQTWSENREYITNIIRSYGNVFIDPEGGKDTAWLTQAGYDALHEYGLSYVPSTNKWTPDVITEAIQSGDPSQIEPRLRAYHDRIFNVGGVLYAHVLSFDNDPVKRHLQHAVLVGIGDIIVYAKYRKLQGIPDAEEVQNLKLKAMHPALFPNANRRQIATSNDSKYYALLKTARDGSERLLVVYNFQPTPQTVRVDLSLVSTMGLQNLKTGEYTPCTDLFKGMSVPLPAYGYKFFDVLPPRN